MSRMNESCHSRFSRTWRVRLNDAAHDHESELTCAMQYSEACATQCSEACALQCSAVQCSAVQCSALQCSAVQCSDVT